MIYNEIIHANLNAVFCIVRQKTALVKLTLALHAEILTEISALTKSNGVKNLRSDAPMSTRFLCEYCALTLALLTAAASMALLERVGVERGEPLVRGEEVTAAKTKTKKRNAMR